MLLLAISFLECWLPWLLWALLPLLGLLLGWFLWGKLRGEIDALKSEIGGYKTRISGYEGDISGYKSQVASLEGDVSGFQNRLVDMDAASAGWKDKRAELNSEIALLQGQLREAGNAQAGTVVDDGRISKLEGDLADCEAARGRLNQQIVDLEKEAASKASESAISRMGIMGETEGDASSAGSNIASFAAGAATTGGSGDGSGTGSIHAYRKAVRADNLQVVEGIGPKMNEVLNNNGITTWAGLASKSPQELRSLLDSVNESKYRIIDPTTWPQQAALADKDDWDGLIELQKNLDTGRDTGTKSNAKVEKMLIKAGAIKKWGQDDLTAVEGIGPKTAQLLKNEGITTWQALSETSVEAIQAILTAAGSRFQLSDPGTWPKQAGMAARDEWDELKTYQDFLDGGK